MNVLYFAIEKELKSKKKKKGSETGNAKCGKMTGGDLSNLVNASRL